MPRQPGPTPPQRGFGTKAWANMMVAGMNQQDSAIAIDDNEFKWLENYVRAGKGYMRAGWDIGPSLYECPPGVAIVSIYPFTIGTIFYHAVFLSDGSAVQVNAVTGVPTQIGGAGLFYETGGSLPCCKQWGTLYLLISNRNTINDYWAWDGTLLYGKGTAAPNGVDLLATGNNYNSLPTVTAFGGLGSGMTFKPVINEGGVVNVEITAPGSGYEPGDVVQLAFTGGGSDTSAILTANLNQGGVTAVSVTAGGSLYTAPVIGFTGGGGSGAAATAVVSTGVNGVTMTNTGANYTTATVSFSGGGGTGANGTPNIVGGQIVSVTMNSGGSGYTSAPTVAFAGDGSGAAGTATIDNGAIISINVTAPGSGYTTAPTVTITDGTGSGASAQAILTASYVKGVTVVQGGTGFVYNPNLLFVGGGGSGASGIALLTPTSIARVDLTSGGSNYQNAPKVYFSGGSQFGAGTPAVATAKLADGAVSSITLTSPGSGFETIPAVILLNQKSDTTGAGAGAVARLVPTSIASVEMSSLGLGYNTAPAVEVQSGANNAAYATVDLMPFGISGDIMETFQARVWIGNPAPSPYNTLPPGGDWAVTTAGQIWDFATSDGGVLFTNSDGFLQTKYTGIRQSSGYNYFFGDGSVSIVSGVQTSGNPPTTTFSYQNVDPQTGCSWRDTLQDFSKTILFANETGVFGLYGGVATKVSAKLDRLFQSAIFPPQNGAITPVAAVATLFEVKHYVMLMTVLDPDTQAFRNVMIAWNEKDWYVLSQSVALTYIATQKVDSKFTAWGTDGTYLYPLFSAPSATLEKRLDTKLYGLNGGVDMVKDALYAYVVAGDLSGLGIVMTPTYDMAAGWVLQPLDEAYQSVAGGLATAGVQQTVQFPAGVTGNPGVWGTKSGGVNGLFIGLRLTTTSPDFELLSLQISYRDSTPLQ